MAGNQDQKIVVGLDIGTTKIVAIVAKVIDCLLYTSPSPRD